MLYKFLLSRRFVLIQKKKKSMYFLESRITNFQINPRHFYKNFFSLVENTFLKFYIYIHMYNTYKTPLYARCKFHSRVSYTNFTIPGSWRAGCRWQLLPFLLYVSPPLSLQRSLPRIQAVLNREKWIF